MTAENRLERILDWTVAATPPGAALGGNEGWTLNALADRINDDEEMATNAGEVRQALELAASGGSHWTNSEIEPGYTGQRGTRQMVRSEADGCWYLGKLV